MLNKIFCELSKIERKKLKKRLLLLGISRKTAKRYAKGEWTIPREIQDKLNSQGEEK